MLGFDDVSLDGDSTSPLKNPADAPRISSALATLEEFGRNSVYPVVIADGQRITQFSNEAFSDLCGYEPSEIAGRKVGELIQGKDTSKKTVRQMRTRLNDRLPFSFRILNYHKDDFSYITGGVVLPFHTEGGDPYFFAVERELEDLDEDIESDPGFSAEVTRVLNLLRPPD